MEKEFAVIETGGKQYMVSAGDTVKIEKIKGDFKPGDSVVFDKVLLVDNGSDTTTIGEPYIKGASVTAEVMSVGRAPKVTPAETPAPAQPAPASGQPAPQGGAS